MEQTSQSWLNLLDSTNSDDDSKISMPPKIVVEDSSHDRSREIEIEFHDTENEKKFDKLVQSNKIKSPFKRRLSNEKLSDDPGDEHEDDQNQKRTKRDDESSPTKRHRKDSCESSSTGSSYFNRELETNREILDRRQKQIDYGKNTLGYDHYIKKVAKNERTREHPKTPPKHLKFSRRAWEGLVKSWRKKLHKFDPKSQNGASAENGSEDEV